MPQALLSYRAQSARAILTETASDLHVNFFPALVSLLVTLFVAEEWELPG